MSNLKQGLGIFFVGLCLVGPFQVEASFRCPNAIKEFVNPVYFVKQRSEDGPGWIARVIGKLVPPSRAVQERYRDTRAYRIWLYIDWTLGKVAIGSLGLYVGGTYYQYQTMAQEIKAAEVAEAYLDFWNESVEESLERLERSN